MRIAREVHDVVGHSLSVINMQAGVALHVLDKRPEQVAESLEAIRKTSKEALAELRTTLEVFRDPDGMSRRHRAQASAGSTTWSARCVRRPRDAVEQAAPDLGHLPAAVDQAAFRIVQEALTNVVRHAGQARRPSGSTGGVDAGGRGRRRRRRPGAASRGERHPWHAGTG